MLLYNWVVFGGISELFWALGQGLLVDRRLNCLKVRNSCLGTSSRAGHWTRFGFQCTARRRQSWRGIIPAASAQKLIQFCVLQLRARAVFQRDWPPIDLGFHCPMFEYTCDSIALRRATDLPSSCPKSFVFGAAQKFVLVLVRKSSLCVKSFRRCFGILVRLKVFIYIFSL